ncbi:uncharacterized protein LOC126844201 [Adelges cooleyi]|uniref:uncharacterized protein LOC126844201 n=1 Tax=Adelges cooleyi TaxID=133065 RepID=UPI00217F73B4|nr:uncharacterized protein LOC126844201 [Adelges cooleyi]
MIHRHLIRLIIFLLANVHQSFVSSNEIVIEARLNVLLTNYVGWYEMTNVIARLEIVPGEDEFQVSSTQLSSLLQVEAGVLARMYTFLYSSIGWQEITNVRGILETNEDNNVIYNSQDLYNILEENNTPVVEENAEDLYLKAVTLLGCKYMDVLLKYLNLLWQNFMYCQSIGNEKFDKDTIFQHFLQCFMFALNQAKTSLTMFDYLHSALRCFEEMYITYVAYIKEFSDQVTRLSDYSKSQVDTYLLTNYIDDNGSVNVNAIIKAMKSIAGFMIDTLVIIKGLADIRCDLLDANIQTYDLFQKDFKNTYPENSTMETLTYIEIRMNQLRNETIQNFFHGLGFVYDETLNKAIVPVFWSPSMINGELHDTNVNTQ